MPDLKLDPSTWDLYQDPNGNLAQTDDASGETLAQQIKIAIRTILGEWFLNTQCGLDYRGTIWVKGVSPRRVELAIKDVILAVTGVSGITSYNQVIDRKARTLTVACTVQSLAGAIALNEVLNT